MIHDFLIKSGFGFKGFFYFINFINILDTKFIDFFEEFSFSSKDSLINYSKKFPDASFSIYLGKEHASITTSYMSGEILIKIETFINHFRDDIRQMQLNKLEI